MLNELQDDITTSGKSIEDFVEAWLEAGGRLIGDPKEELKWRLNQQVQMIDPGEPLNWRGERGLRGL